ncbi:MAG: carboxypeptidase regulatory-like domain-containing protein [Acidobacteria bacterium]|nr:MAG: carboxypeptidase regulatory-like domain-containing protein [Acidobacteriota bacterium]
MSRRLLVPALVASAATCAAVAAAGCFQPAGGSVFEAAFGRVVRWPEGAEVWRPPAGDPVAVACTGDGILVAVQRESRAEVWEVPSDAAGARLVGRWRGRAVDLLVAGGNPLLVAELGGDRAVLVAARRRHPPVRRLSLAPRSAAVAPDGGAVLVAAGSSLRSFRLPDLGTWLVYPLGFPAGKISVREGSSRIAAAAPDGVRLIDLGDSAIHGRMPVRAESRLGPVADIVWTTREPAAVAVLTRSPPEVRFLRGEDLGEFGRIAVGPEARALVPLPEGSVLVLRGGRPPRRVAAGPPPEGRGAPASVETSADAPRFRPAVPRNAGGGAAAEREPPPDGEKEADRDQTPAAPHPGRRPGPRPAAPEAPAGKIEGSLRGRVELAAEVVLVGPDDILREWARLAPDPAGPGRAGFRAEGLPPGRYRVMIFGPGGASLDVRPEVADVRVGPGETVRLRFEVRGLR